MLRAHGNILWMIDQFSVRRCARLVLQPKKDFFLRTRVQYSSTRLNAHTCSHVLHVFPTSQESQAAMSASRRTMPVSRPCRVTKATCDEDKGEDKSHVCKTPQPTQHAKKSNRTVSSQREAPCP